MRLNASIRPIGGTWRPLTGRIIGGHSRTFEHGYLSAQAVLDVYESDAIALYAQSSTLEMVIYIGAHLLFEGDVTDIKPAVGKTIIEASGPWASLGNRPYTAAYRVEKISDFQALTNNQNSTTYPELYDISVNESIVMALKNDTDYPASYFGHVAYLFPDGGRNEPRQVTFDYDFVSPGASFFGGVRPISAAPDGYSGAISLGSGVWSSASTGTGSQTVSIAAGNVGVAFYVLNNSGVQTFTGDGSDGRYIFSNVVITSYTGTDYAGDIISDVVDMYQGDTSPRISSDTSQIENGAALAGHIVYEDADARRAIEALEVRGDGSELYSAAVWDSRILTFKPLSWYENAWIVNAVDVNTRRSIGDSYTGVLPLYEDGANGSYTLRGTLQNDEELETLYEYERIKTRKTDTTSSTEAEAQAALDLSDSGASPRLSIKTKWIQDKTGHRIPAYYVRALDLITIQGLPVAAAENIGTIRLKETRFDFRTGEVQLIPQKRPSELVQYLARQ